MRFTRCLNNLSKSISRVYCFSLCDHFIYRTLWSKSCLSLYLLKDNQLCSMFLSKAVLQPVWCCQIYNFFLLIDTLTGGNKCLSCNIVYKKFIERVMYVLYFKYLFIWEYALIICGDADGVAVSHWKEKNEIFRCSVAIYAIGRSLPNTNVKWHLVLLIKNNNIKIFLFSNKNQSR